MLKAYLNLGKPRISLLFAITGLAGLVLQGGLLSVPAQLCWVVFGIFCVSVGANGLNQYFERDIDKAMARTAKKRPLPLGELTPHQALVFSTVSCILGVYILHLFGTWLASLIGLATILFYSFYYTLWLKPRTPYNIVIGGAAGATAPLIGWAAAEPTLSMLPWLLFLLIFLWTPPHFWALALCCKDDYRSAGYPMLPLVAGDAATYRQIIYYAWTLLPTNLAIWYYGGLSTGYGVIVSLLTLAFIVLAHRLQSSREIKFGWIVFAYSIIYLLCIFVFLIADALL